MTIYYLDSSALVKRYLNETGSAWVASLFATTPDNEVFIAAITSVEVTAAITRRARGGSIESTDAAAACQTLRADLATDYQIVELSEPLLTSAATVAETHALRGYDAVQLAAALAVNRLCVGNALPPITFVSADDELNMIAATQGMVVDNPHHHL